MVAKPRKPRRGLRNVRKWSRYFKKSMKDAYKKRIVREAEHHSKLGANRRVALDKKLEAIQKRRKILPHRSEVAIFRRIILDTALRNSGAKRELSAKAYGRLYREMRRWMGLLAGSRPLLASIKARYGHVDRKKLPPAVVQKLDRIYSVFQAQDDAIKEICGEKLKSKLLKETRNLLSIAEQLDW